MFPLHSIAAALWSFWQRGRTVERIGYVVGALLLASGLVHLCVLAIGGGSWEGPVSLRKAMTFGLSFGLTLITVAWVASLLRLGNRSRTLLLGAFTAACALETILISLQAWRGVPSHFNLETPFDSLIARTLAAGGGALIAIVATLTIAAFRRNPMVPISLRVAIRIGFVTLCSSLVVGALMIAKGMRLVFAGDRQAAYTIGGTLKPTHAVTMHAILVLPMLAWLLSFVDWTERRRLAVVLLAVTGYVVLASVVAAENVTGLAPRDTPLAIVALLVVGGLALVAAGALTVNGVARSFTPDGIEHE
jgi:hypothetical protein